MICLQTAALSLNSGFAAQSTSPIMIKMCKTYSLRKSAFYGSPIHGSKDFWEIFCSLVDHFCLWMNYKYFDIIIFSRIKIWNWEYQLSMENILGFEYFKECIVKFCYNLFKFSYLFKVLIPNNISIVLKYLILEFVSNLSF